jgi:hypothetical protein
MRDLSRTMRMILIIRDSSHEMRKDLGERIRDFHQESRSGFRRRSSLVVVVVSRSRLRRWR